MSDIWKSVEIFLPSDMSKEDVRDTLLDEVICTATDAGDFVHRLRVSGSVAHTDGWRKWTASYLPGPPGVFRCKRLLGPGETTSSGPGKTSLSRTDAASIPVV